MSTSLTRPGAGPVTRARLTRSRAVVNRDDERMYVRFYAAAAIGLVLGGIQGVIQRLPGISDWLYAAGYGGHLITNLAQTHIIMVGAGTLTLTATMYYLLPRLLNRPLYSQSLTRWSFWFTVVGVYGFYFVMLIEGLVLGSAVTHNVPYDTARRVLGVWYDLPTGLAGGIMGVGYWLFVANIYLTTRGPKSWKGPESFIVKYIFLGTTGLFIGTLQGFYQILPWSVNFIRATGLAGEEIDPVAHAHINMVCGVAVTLMGMSYYILPRMLGKPIWNLKLARVSFWLTAIGVIGFWLSLIFLGITEGNIMLGIMRDSNVTVDAAYYMAVARVGIWHNLLRAGFGTIMGIGFWSYILIIFKTFRGQPSASAYPKRLVAGDVAVPPPDKDSRFNSYFFLATTIAMLIGTIQGVIQILPFASNWLDAAGQAGDMITPLAHAQMNIVASVGFGLMGLVYFTLPKLSGKPWMSLPLIRVSLVLMIVGISMYYVSLLTLGFIESVRVHQLLAAGGHNELDAFNIARAEVGWAHPFWLSFSNVFLAAAYITYAANVLLTLGPENLRGSAADGVLRTIYLLDGALNVAKRQKVSAMRSLRLRAARTFFVELGMGWFGFMGAGWLTSGRLALGFSLFFTWFTGWIMYVEWNLTTQNQVNGPDFGFVLPMLPLYFGLPIVSASCATITYLRRGLRRRPKVAPTPVTIVESSALLIDEDATPAPAEPVTAEPEPAVETAPLGGLRTAAKPVRPVRPTYVD